jgi:Berberine and berberine like
MLSSLHGLGADQILSVSLVTADGNFLTASPSENSDLFWAVRGGGGSAFGVVTSMVVKAFKEVETTIGTVEWGVKINNVSADNFWQGVSTYFKYFSNFTGEGMAAEWFLYPKTNGLFPPPSDGQPRFSLTAFFAPGKSVEQTKAITTPWLEEMKALGINLALNWTHFPTYHAAFSSLFPSTPYALMPYNLDYASRLIPRENFDKTQKLNTTIVALRTLAGAGRSFNGYMYAPTLAAGSPVGKEGNAVHPSWRETLSHTIAFLKWAPEATAAQQLQLRKAFVADGMKPLRDAMPGAGSYMNEGSRIESGFQQLFYGTNYERLAAIKKKFDPNDVFWAATAVGSDGWEVRSVDGLPDETGRLCRAETKM